VLRAVGLQPSAATTVPSGHATASRRNADGVALARLSAGSQAVSPLPNLAGGMPIVMLPLEDGVALRTSVGHQIISVGQLLLLPRKSDWSVAFQRDMRAVVLSVASDAFHGRKISQPAFSEVRVMAPGGFTEVFSRTLDSAARSLETLSDIEWTAVAQSLADLLPIFMRQLRRPHGNRYCDAGGDLHRICRRSSAGSTIPTHAGAGGASRRNIERYLCSCSKAREALHALFARAPSAADLGDLSNPAEAHHSISKSLPQRFQ
jgi:hypothetical protein